MDRRRFVLLAAIVGSGSVAGAVELAANRARTRPGCLEGIPGSFNYQYRPRSESVFSGSQRGVLFAVPVRDTADQLRERGSLLAVFKKRPLASAVEGSPATPPATSPTPMAGGQIPEGEWTVGTAEELPAQQPSPTFEGPRNAAPRRLFQRTDRPLAMVGSDPEPVPPGKAQRDFGAAPNVSNAPNASAAVAKPATRLYQLHRGSLAVDHCQVSEIALLLRADAIWSLSLRADQNRRADAPDEARYNPQLHLKRNEFHVRLRCLGGLDTANGPTSQAAGQPILAIIEPEPFWVERGQPKFHRMTGFVRSGDQQLDSLDIALIDRVEIEFFYR